MRSLFVLVLDCMTHWDVIVIVAGAKDPIEKY